MLYNHFSNFLEFLLQIYLFNKHFVQAGVKSLLGSILYQFLQLQKKFNIMKYSYQLFACQFLMKKKWIQECRPHTNLQHPMTSHTVNHFLNTWPKYYMYHAQYLFKIHFLAYVPNTISITHIIFFYLHVTIFLIKTQGMIVIVQFFFIECDNLIVISLLHNCRKKLSILCVLLKQYMSPTPNVDLCFNQVSRKFCVRSSFRNEPI